MDIKDKVVIITGASEGIGLSTARRFAAEGAKLALAARSVDKLEVLATELRQQGREALVVPTDMREAQSVQRMVAETVKHFGRVNVLVNNAGQSVAGTVAEVDTNAMRQVVELNMFGPVYAIQAVVPYMRQNGGGIIVNISSMTSKMAIPGLAGYASTKAALNLISQTARVELASENIRVLLVLPRTTATDFGKNALGDRAMRERQRQHATARQVIVDSPEHVAGKILEAVQEEAGEKYMEE